MGFIYTAYIGFQPSSWSQFERFKVYETFPDPENPTEGDVEHDGKYSIDIEVDEDHPDITKHPEGAWVFGYEVDSPFSACTPSLDDYLIVFSSISLFDHACATLDTNKLNEFVKLFAKHNIDGELVLHMGMS